MRKLFIKAGLLFFSSFVITNMNGQEIDTIARIIIEKHLKIVERYLTDNKSDSSLLRAESIAFLSELTSIPSSSPGNYLGQYSPSEWDLILWKNWYKKNKEFLIWDDTLRVIKFCKNISPPNEQ